MRIYNAAVFTDGAFTAGGIDFDERIRACGAGITDGDLDAGGAYLIPGLVDIHTHAAMGEDVSDGRPEGLQILGRWYASRGVTSWCPTTMTLQEPELTAAIRAICSYERPADGARMAGIHLEGPFLSHAKCGAQNPENLHAPDIALFRRLYAQSGGRIRLLTAAPEEPGATELIREAARVCTVSLGHTAADYETAAAGYAAGATHTAHLFNAMPSLQHRAPGVVGAAFDCGATAEVICDGLHIHPAVVRMIFRLFGDRTVLISDSLRCTGMPDGVYMLGGQQVCMQGGRATLQGTDTLAGSCIHLLDGLRNAVSYGVPLEHAVTAATAVPAGVIGLEGEIGSIAPGLYADFLLLDAALRLQAVYIGGRPVAV